MNRVVGTLHKMKTTVIEFECLNDECLTRYDFEIQEIRDGNRHNLVGFVIKDGDLFKGRHLCIPRTLHRDFLTLELCARIS